LQHIGREQERLVNPAGAYRLSSRSNGEPGPMCKRYIAYRRVSTDQQGRSGLGLEAQEAAVKAFIEGRGADAKLLATYTEVESGKHDARPELVKAMDHAKLTGSTLLIAKLDRLSRDAHFLLGLQNAGVAFTACDMPHADQFTVGIMALVAQKEREAISQRTKEALAAAKARGVKLGNPNGARHLRQFDNSSAVAALKSVARERAEGLRATIETIQAQGITAANAIARTLNQREIATARDAR
jgi:DNA invertase Pin-like site-specific DNA recombinase